MPSRIGTNALFQSQLSYLMRLQTQQSLVNTQIATGFKSQTFAGVAKDAGSIISSSAIMSRIDQYNQNITIANNRASLMQLSLDNIDKSVSTLQGYLAQLSDATTPPDVPTLAKDLLNQVTDYLNLSDGTRYLFSGSNVNTAPVKTLSAGGGVAPTVPAVPASLTNGRNVASVDPLPLDFSVTPPVPTALPAPWANYDNATNTYFRPDPDDPTVLQSVKIDLPPLTTLELTRDAATQNLEAGRVIEGTNGARGRIVYLTDGTANTGRVYIEPLNELPFLPNDTFTLNELGFSGTTYVETPIAGQTFTAIGGLRNANIDTQSIQINGALPLGIKPGVTLEIGGAGNRFIVESVEPATTAGGTPVLQVRPLGTATITATGASRAIGIVNPQTGVAAASGVGTRVGPGGFEQIGPVADYQTNATGVGSTGYYTNPNAAREILNPQKIQVSDNSTVEYGINADEAGFARLIYTLNFLQQQSSPLSKEDVAAANKILGEARTQLTSMRASLGINQKTLAGIQEENTLQKSIANNNFDLLAKQDRTEAIATLTSLSTILEASYQSFAQVQSLNLHSYLR